MSKQRVGESGVSDLLLPRGFSRVAIELVGIGSGLAIGFGAGNWPAAFAVLLMVIIGSIAHRTSQFLTICIPTSPN